MSVPVGQRGKSKLDAHTKTEELVLHTLTITSNQNVFLDRNQALTKLVNECAVGIGRDVWQANLVRVGSDPRKWVHRRELQERACAGGSEGLRRWRRVALGPMEPPQWRTRDGVRMPRRATTRCCWRRVTSGFRD